jgi:hypothetical protein
MQSIDQCNLARHPHTFTGECSAEELERLMTIVANPRNYKIPDWFLNRQRDYKTGRFLHVSLAVTAAAVW